MTARSLRLRRDGPCAGCSQVLPAGTRAWWDAEARTITCAACADTPAAASAGVAGRSARAEYEKRSEREQRRVQADIERDTAWRQQVRTHRPVLGRILTAMTPKPAPGHESQPTTAWKRGAEGEEIVGLALAAFADVVALHDRRVPGTRGNIDHLAVGPGGVYVIDAKHHSGMVERRDVGSLLRPDERLYVDGRDRTSLVRQMDWQVDAVRSALDECRQHHVAVTPVLCFVGAEWPLLFSRPLRVNNVIALWPSALERLVRSGHLLDDRGREDVARALAVALPAK